MIVERAPAKLNLLLHLGRRRRDGLHELCSLFASIDLADEVAVEAGEDEVAVEAGEAGEEEVAVKAGEVADRVICPQVEGPNLCDAALRALRRAIAVSMPPLTVTVRKRIPIAAGLGGGSADAAAVLRAANAIAGRPLEPPALRKVAAAIGADVPSQVEPRHSLVTGAGEAIEPVELPAMGLVLVPSSPGLSTADVYAEADRIGAPRERLDPGPVRALAAAPLPELAGRLENDLQQAALSLRPELEGALTELRQAGALTALITGSGPTTFGVFSSEREAERAASRIDGAVAVRLARPADPAE